jgi:uncharacterized glyoxalase superfamily protein PhnB
VAAGAAPPPVPDPLEENTMAERVVPMIHVPDVRATAEWYRTLGFTVLRYNEEDGDMNWALLRLGSSEIMLSEGGKPSTADRREFDLYVHTDDIEGWYNRLKDQVEVREDLHDTFYGQREFIIRDLNGFWLTFGQPLQER